MEKHYYIFKLPLDLLTVCLGCLFMLRVVATSSLLTRALKEVTLKKETEKKKKANNVYNMLKFML